MFTDYLSAARLPYYIDHCYGFLMKNFGGLVQSLELKNYKITTMQVLSKSSWPVKRRQRDSPLSQKFLSWLNIQCFIYKALGIRRS